MNKESRFRPDLPIFYKRYLETLRSLSEEEFELLLDGANINLEVAPPPVEGLEINSVWQQGNRWNVSYKATKETRKDIWKAIREETLEDLKSFRPDYPKIKRIKTDSKKLYLLSLTDIHFGKEILGETGKRVHNVVDSLLSRLDEKKDKEFLFIVGNDILNTDFGQATTKNTPQFNFSEPRVTFREARRCMVEVIEKLLSLGTVHLIHVPSNHDYYRGAYLYDCICQRYHNNDNVTFEEDLDDRQYFQFGECGFMFEHGELKVNDYEVIFATEKPNIFCKTKHREVILGHLHHEQVHQKRGCKIRFLPCISANDSWHKKKGYISPKQQQLFIYDHENGLETIHEITCE